MTHSEHPVGLYRIKLSKQYRRDLRQLAKAGHDLRKLERIIDRLAEGKPLDPAHRDHELKGQYAGIRECHIAPDWLLMYQRDHRQLLLLLLRTGTHSRLFHE